MASAQQPIRLHRFALSGHAHRAELMLSLLRLPVELIDVDLRGGAHKKPEFLRLNPFGQVPVIEDGETTVADSNAILVYLAQRYDSSGAWLPRDAVLAAQVQRWLSVAAGPLARGAAAARVSMLFAGKSDADAQAIAVQCLGLVDQHLAGRSWLVGDAPTIADIALYSYSAHAPEGGVSLEPWPALRAWLARVEALPGFVAMARTPVQA